MITELAPTAPETATAATGQVSLRGLLARIHSYARITVWRLKPDGSWTQQICTVTAGPYQEHDGRWYVRVAPEVPGLPHEKIRTMVDLSPRYAPWVAIEDIGVPNDRDEGTAPVSNPDVLATFVA